MMSTVHPIGTRRWLQQTPGGVVAAVYVSHHVPMPNRVYVGIRFLGATGKICWGDSLHVYEEHLSNDRPDGPLDTDYGTESNDTPETEARKAGVR